MSPEHTRFERLAVGHVLGGLDEVEAAAFRSHLLGCRECRLRVSELRGIASDLAAAERDERASAMRVATEVARRQQEAPPQPEPPTGWRSWPWAVVATAVVVAVMTGVLFWNLALRERSATVLGTARQQEQVLVTLADGELLDTSLETGSTGLVALDDEFIAIDVVGIRTPAPDEAVVVWQYDADEAVIAQSDPFTRSAGMLVDGRFVAAVPAAEGVVRVQLLMEQVPFPKDAPAGDPLLTSEVAPGTAGRDVTEPVDGQG